MNPINNTQQKSTISVWRDVKTDEYYALPNISSLSAKGEITLCNCFTLEIREAKLEEIKSYSVNQETAVNYLLQKIENTIPDAAAHISNLFSTLKQETHSDNYKRIQSALDDADWTQIIAEYLDLTPSQIENHPELFEQKLHSLLRNFANAIAEKEMVYRADAQIEAVKIQDALANSGINIGNALELLLGYLKYLYLSEESSSPEAIKELQSKIAALKNAFGDEKSLEDAIRAITQNEELWSDNDPSISATDTMEERVQKSVRKAFDEMESEHPFPSFSFEDLLGNKTE